MLRLKGWTAQIGISTNRSLTQRKDCERRLRQSSRSTASRPNGAASMASHQRWSLSMRAMPISVFWANRRRSILLPWGTPLASNCCSLSGGPCCSSRLWDRSTCEGGEREPVGGVSNLDVEVPGGAHLSREHGVALGGAGADEVLGLGVPVERNAQS